MANTFFGFDAERSFEYENGFYLTSPLSRIGKLLGHYELYKRITQLPGEIVECGVYKGASLLRFLSFRELLESPDSRKLIAFDAFGRFPETADSEDTAFIERFAQAGGDGISVAELRRILTHKGFRNTELVAGDINRTLPDYVKAHLELRIALLHVDVDCYEPTVTILEQLFDRMVPGGLVVFDDYGKVAGETRAVDEFLRQHPRQLQKLSICHVPTYLVH
ncbi:MAG: TylF/MycF/NovP-related O-methyltransferase [Deltaproteobacteria bacterium]